MTDSSAAKNTVTNMKSEIITNIIRDIEKAAQAQYEYNMTVNIPQGININDPQQHALEVALVSTLSKLTDWDISEARRIAADLLEDVNDREGAAAIQALD